MSDLHLIEDGAIFIENGIIKAVGKTEEITARYKKKKVDTFDARNKAVLPGFIDSHTHFLFSGDRSEEFSWRIGGASYIEILQRGGGILSTVNATRKASKKELFHEGRKRLEAMLSYGVTTVEGKSGYGLDLETEIKQLEVMGELDEVQPIEIVPTFLGAHVVPPEYKNKNDAYIDFIIRSVLPVVNKKDLAHFCDVFCEDGVFSVEQSRKLLSEAQRMGMKLKIHADEIQQLGGAELAAELSAISADHLLHVSETGIERMANTGVVATLLPGTAFCLKEKYAPARNMIDKGLAVALATDLNPGTFFSQSIPLILALAVFNMDMSIEEAITAITINAAAALGKADHIGGIDIQKQGDLVILAFPSYNYLTYHTGINIVETVIKKGNIAYDRNKAILL